MADSHNTSLHNITLKPTLFAVLLLTKLFSCQKNKDDANPLSYELPWKTEHINYKNSWDCNGGDYAGYKLYYKDKLIKEECSSERLTISDSKLVND